MTSGSLPFCSVVVPTFRRPVELGACLEALSGLDYPRERFEVVVVDDGGGGVPLGERLAPYRSRLALTLVEQVNAGPAAARNAGVARAGGELLVFTDDDCAPEPRWLGALAACAAAEPGCVVGGRTVNALPSNPFAEASQVVSDLVYDHYNAEPGRARFFASNNLALPAALFRALGGFDERFRFAEDRELCDRALHRGARLVYAPDAVVRHEPALTAGAFWRQHFRYGKGAYLFHRVRAERGSGRLRSDLRFHLGLPAAGVRRLARAQGQRPALAALLVVWQVANASGFAWAAARRLARSL